MSQYALFAIPILMGIALTIAVKRLNKHPH